MPNALLLSKLVAKLIVLSLGTTTYSLFTSCKDVICVDFRLADFIGKEIWFYVFVMVRLHLRCVLLGQLLVIVKVL